MYVSQQINQRSAIKYKYKHAVFIQSPLLKIRLNSNFICSKKPSQLLQTTLQWHSEEGGFFYSQWDRVLHLSALYVTCVISAHLKIRHGQLNCTSVLTVFLYSLHTQVYTPYNTWTIYSEKVLINILDQGLANFSCKRTQ